MNASGPETWSIIITFRDLPVKNAFILVSCGYILTASYLKYVESFGSVESKIIKISAILERAYYAATDVLKILY